MAASNEEQTTREIDHLLAFVAASGCTFHRNGGDHDSKAAADHMRLKYGRGKRYADTADHFIDRLASQSSWTGKPYTVTCNGKNEPSGDWLNRELSRYRSTADSPTPVETGAGI
jgi:hypothetical protein